MYPKRSEIHITSSPISPGRKIVTYWDAVVESVTLRIWLHACTSVGGAKRGFWDLLKRGRLTCGRHLTPCCVPPPNLRPLYSVHFIIGRFACDLSVNYVRLPLPFLTRKSSDY